MIALLHKELDGVRPYWYAVLAMCVWFAGNHLMEPIGLQPLSVVATDGVESWGLVCSMLAFSLGHSLPSKEYSQGHIEFLDGLPVSRLAVFVAKVVAAALPLLVLVLGTGLIKWVACELGGAPEGLAVWPVIVAQMIRLASLCVGFVGLGLALSWLGGLGWGVMLVMSFLGMTLAVPIHALRPYSFFDGMMSIDWDGTEPIAQWGPVAFWTTIGVISTGISGIMFLGPGRVVMSDRTWTGGVIRVVAMGCGSLLFLAIALLASLGVALQHGERFLSSTTVHQTRYFAFLYPTDRSVQALRLIGEADGINEELSRVIGSDGPVELEVELLGASTAHAGVFLGGKIRMGLRDARQTLTHELAHAHAYSLMGGEMTRHFDKTRFFQEGFATHFENELSDNRGGSAWAGAIYRTEQARFDLLVDDDRRREKHDPDQAYPLGEVFVRALVAEYGPTAPACAQRRLGEIGHRDVAGMSLWYEVMRGCDFELDRVVVRYDAMLSEAADELPELPDLTARVGQSGGRTALFVHDGRGLGGKLVCRFRDRSDQSRNQYKQTTVLRDGACRVGAEVISGRTFQYQLGFYVEGEAFPVYLEWTTAPI